MPLTPAAETNRRSSTSTTGRLAAKPRTICIGKPIPLSPSTHSSKLHGHRTILLGLVLGALVIAPLVLMMLFLTTAVRLRAKQCHVSTLSKYLSLAQRVRPLQQYSLCNTVLESLDICEHKRPFVRGTRSKIKDRLPKHTRVVCDARTLLKCR